MLAAFGQCAQYSATGGLWGILGFTTPTAAAASVAALNTYAAPAVSVTGLLGRGLRLELSTGAALDIASDGTYVFAGEYPVGSTYEIRLARAPTAPAQNCALSAASGTLSAATTPTIVQCGDTIAPVVLGTAALSAQLVRVYFSRPMSQTEVLTPANYTLSEIEASCAGNAAYLAAATVDVSVTSVQEVSGEDLRAVELVLSGALQNGKRYFLGANRATLRDRSQPANALDCPSGALVQWGSPPRLLSARCAAGARGVLLTFSAPMLYAGNAPHPAHAVSCSGAADCALRFRIFGPLSAGSINAVRIPDGVVCDGAPADTSGTRFCLEHEQQQSGGSYTVVAANARDGDGFDNTACGWGTCELRDATDTFGLDPSPGDRALFAGCGDIPTSPAGGPVSVDPYGDGGYFGFLVHFANRIFIGPGPSGHITTHMRPDGTDPRISAFEFERDTTGLVTHANNTAPALNGIGFAGCVPGSVSALTNCGPHNENGRGAFASGTIDGVPYLFLGGARPTAGNNDYIYFAREVHAQMRFSYLDLSAIFNGTTPGPNDSNRGVESMVTFHNRLYVAMPGDNINRPYVLRVNTLNSEVVNGVDSEWLYINTMTGMGQNTLFAHPRPAYGDRLGATLAVFRDRLYIASTGSVFHAGGYGACPPGSTYPTCQNDGGIIRSENTLPAPCSNAGTCNDWADTTPASVAFRRNFSIVLASSADLHPYQRPYPAFVEYAGQLYMARNACATSVSNYACPTNAICADDGLCPNPVPQLWKCHPESTGDAGECDANDWSLVAGGGAFADTTNMGDAGNRAISLLAAHAGRLYVGFDNTLTGAELWRTRGGVTDPTPSTDFEQVGADGFDDPANRRRFYSVAGAADDVAAYLYMSVGDSSAPLGIFVQKE